MIICLSYPLNRSAPLYPGTPGLEIAPFESIEQGDASNSSMISFNSHAGTHIDLPRHFCPEGGTVADLLLPETIFEPACCIALRKGRDDPLEISDFERLPPAIRDVEAILIRTGSHRERASNPGEYAVRHPWVHPDIPDYLRREYPGLRLFGLDAISIARPDRPDEGLAAHQGFLCKSPPIAVLEDLDLSGGILTEGCWRLRIYPLVHDDLDGVPVIALAEAYE
ncbi:MAG: cyclase family protein [Methanomicrobiaceae archaeon]|uniref:Metal-dependent hydrolase n=1 Tax=hydrocarbon metagenome TaxID=938273 RepID=A0A0W8FI00_9ZZZZ|nr:cyclase family protein [Methanomicrobiaceae archaeon]MDD5419889.1 cyclase family protein [Methanomicrobiaceae archaeon]